MHFALKRRKQRLQDEITNYCYTLNCTLLGIGNDNEWMAIGMDLNPHSHDYESPNIKILPFHYHSFIPILFDTLQLCKMHANFHSILKI